MASDDDVENPLLEEAYYNITETWTTEDRAPVLVSVDVTATRVVGRVELECNWLVSNWKAAEQSNFDYGFNSLAIVTEPSQWLVFDVGPTAKAFWKAIVRAVNDGDAKLATYIVKAPGGRMQVHIDMRVYGFIEDERLDGSVPKPFVTADGEVLDIVVIHKDGYALLPPSSYDLDGEKQEFTGDEEDVTVLDDADMIGALLTELGKFTLPQVSLPPAGGHAPAASDWLMSDDEDLLDKPLSPRLQELQDRAARKQPLRNATADSEEQDGPAKRTRLAGQAAAAPPAVGASQRWKDTTIKLYPGDVDELWKYIRKAGVDMEDKLETLLEEMKTHIERIKSGQVDASEELVEIYTLFY
jgi:hypothetical protein